MKDFLHHLLIPRESNNHRPKILHHQSLIIVIAFFFVAQIFISVIKHNYQSVLGNSTDISPEVMLSLTNQERIKKGLKELDLNEQLSNAAYLKGQNMLELNYWAHNAPDGTTPWFFVKKTGYNYVYAGENLARGFSTSSDIINAWMASPSHRDNILSQNYKDIGFAVLEGNLLNEQTTLVVEMFGSTRIIPTTSDNTNKNQKILVAKPSVKAEAIVVKPIVDSFSFTKNIGLITVFSFIFILVLDAVIIERKKVARLVGHNLDHIMFLSAIFIVMVMINRGLII